MMTTIELALTFFVRIVPFATDCLVSLLSFTSKGMYPQPPELFKGKGVTDDPAGETYWKVANGIRLTGMPIQAP
jgi:hypothetical protein